MHVALPLVLYIIIICATSGASSKPKAGMEVDDGEESDETVDELLVLGRDDGQEEEEESESGDDG